MVDKRCSRCGLVKDVAEFNWLNYSKPRTGGCWRAHCRACTTATARAWHDAHPHVPKPPRPLAPEKRCNRCGEVKPRAEFYGVPHYPRELLPYCKVCIRAQTRARYQADPAAWKAGVLEWSHEHPHRKNEITANYRARAKNAPVVERIDRAAIIARDNGTCYLCGGKPTGRSLHLDHVIPLSRGGSHTADNLRVCCHRCNSRKWRHLTSELESGHIIDKEAV